MSLSTEYLIRNSYFELKDVGQMPAVEKLGKEAKVEKMEKSFEKFYGLHGAEYLVTGSDDNTVNLYVLGRLGSGSSGTTQAGDSQGKNGLGKRGGDQVDLASSKTLTKFSFKDSLKEKIKESESFSLVRKYTGHSKPINHVQFAPNGFLFISASFDKSLRVWNVAQNGCLAVLRGHVGAVYR